MFNMYQELVDRINELLKENEKLRYLYGKIPFATINTLYKNEMITEDDLSFWYELRRSKRDKENNK